MINQVNEKVNKLTFTYREYIRNNQSLEGITIGPYKIQKQLGKGAFGNIYYAENDQKQSFALKMLDLVSVKEERNPKIKQIRWRLVKSQPGLMQLCDSPNVLKCYDIFQNQDLKILVLEYCNGKTLEEYLKKKKKIPEEEAVAILRQIINGLAELHKNSIVHRDLKAENIMEHEGCYKIIDLGFSKKLDIINQTAQIQGTTLGTVITMAPQVMSKKNYGLKADIWSIGVIFFQMIFGEMPYDSINAKKRYEQIEKKQYFNPNTPLTINKVTASKLAGDFFSRVFQVDTEKRMDWRQLIQHQLIKEKKEEPLCPRFLQRTILQKPDVHKSLIQQTLQQGEFQQEKKQEKKQDPVNPKTRFDDYMKSKSPAIRKQEQHQEHILNQKQIQSVQRLQRLIHRAQSPNRIFQPQSPSKKLSPSSPNKGLQPSSPNKGLQPSSPNKKLQPQEILQPQKQIGMNEDTQQYKWCREGHLQCLKTELIYTQIIIPIKTNQILNLNDREVVELMFLLSARCFNNMSPISCKIQNEKDKSNRMVKNLYEQVRPLYQKVLENFIKFSDNLTSVENKWLSIIKDFLARKFLSQNYNQKNRITTGLENEQNTHYGDYSKNQQISYTFNNFIVKLLPKITNNSIQTIRIKKYLMNYEKLNFVTVVQLNGDNYGDYVRKILG